MRCLGVFGKYWRAGEVKSRLAQDIGPEAAATLYRSFLVTVLDRFATVGDRRVLVYSPAEHHAEFRNLPVAVNRTDGWSLEPQARGDLGHRMAQFFHDTFAAGASRVVLLGSDSPNLPVNLVKQAFGALDEAPVVLGPTADGGYYLVGARDSTPPIFAEVDWSTSSVWRQTIGRLSDHGVSYHTLSAWYDVDRLADLRRLHSDLTDREPRDEPLRSLATTVATALGRSERIT